MKVTIALILVLVGIWIWTLTLSNEQVQYVVDEYGFSTSKLLEGAWWVLFTSSLLHVTLTHLASNVFVLFFFGTAVESEIGPWKMLGIFFLGAIIGDLLSTLIYAPDVVSIGASGGIFALVGAGMLIRPIDLSLYPMPLPLGILGMIYTFYTIIGFFSGEPHISYIAHIGGLLTGLAYGFRREGAERGLRIILVMFLILILFPAIWVYYSQAFSAIIGLI